VIADFRDMVASLVANGARFLVVGAHALAAHGVPRATGDLDIWIEATDDNADAVWKALAEFGVPLTALNLRRADFATPEQVVQIGLPPYRIDIMTSITGVNFRDAMKDALAGTLFEVPVLFLGREAFVTNKRASGRPKDLEDLRSLAE